MQPDIINLAFASERNPRAELFIIEGSPLTLKLSRQRKTKALEHFLEKRQHIINVITDQLDNRSAFTGTIAIQLSFHFPLLQNARLERKSELIGKPYRHNPSLDHLIKLYLECLKDASCFGEECVISWTNAYKVYGVPRTEIIIREVR